MSRHLNCLKLELKSEWSYVHAQPSLEWNKAAPIRQYLASLTSDRFVTKRGGLRNFRNEIWPQSRRQVASRQFDMIAAHSY
jgi:hypothetical protein